MTDSVHGKDGKIFAQLWHTGRVSHSVDKNGVLPVAPSALAITGQQHFSSQGAMDYEVPRALETEEVKQVVQDYKQASINAIDIMLFGGENYAEPIVAEGPFVMNSQEEIIGAYRDFYAGKYGEIKLTKNTIQ